MFSGKKTYVISAVALIWAIVGYALGEVDVPTLTQMVFGALAAAGIRHGIASK